MPHGNSIVKFDIGSTYEVGLQHKFLKIWNKKWHIEI